MFENIDRIKVIKKNHDVTIQQPLSTLKASRKKLLAQFRPNLKDPQFDQTQNKHLATLSSKTTMLQSKEQTYELF